MNLCPSRFGRGSGSGTDYWHDLGQLFSPSEPHFPPVPSPGLAEGVRHAKDLVGRRESLSLIPAINSSAIYCLGQMMGELTPVIFECFLLTLK